MNAIQHLPTSWGKTAYRRSGTGPRLVLLHSLALNSAMWESLIGEWDSDFDIVAVDARGHGASEWDSTPFSVGDLADDVAHLLDALDWPTTSVLGLSMGGSVATVFAQRHADRLARLALCDTTAWYGPDAEETWAARAASAKAKSRTDLVPFQVSRWFSDEFRRRQPHVVNDMVRIFLDTRPTAHSAACLALGALDARDALASITAPTVVLTGADDYATTPEMAQLLHSQIANSECEIFPGLRHFGILESSGFRERLFKHFVAGDSDETSGDSVDVSGK